jgi:hypothetical protein
LKHLVSILIPAHNAEKWIAMALESAIGQTWSPKEVIVVDDGSTDATCQVVKRYEGPFVKLISRPNMGACHARNTAFAVCQGEYLQWLDADDILSPTKIAAQMRDVQIDVCPRTAYTASWSTFIYRIERAKPQRNLLWQDLTSLDWLVTRFGNSGMMPPHAWLVSRELTEAAGPWDERLQRNQDGEYFTRIVAASERVKFVASSHCYYRRLNQASISMNCSRGALQSVVDATEKCLNLVLSMERSDRVATACRQHLNRLIPTLRDQAPDLAERCARRVVELGGCLKVAPRQSKLRQMCNGLRGQIRKVRFNVEVAYDRLYRPITFRASSRAE